MEVDHLGKGKSKGKGKKGKGKAKDGKGKGKHWSPWHPIGSVKGKGKGKSKGKGKMDQDNGSKSKGKEKQSKDGCFYCGKAGHRQSECWKKQQDEAKGIRQVEALASSTTPVAGTTVAATTAEPSASQVRRIDMVDPESCCVIYDLSNEELQDTAFCDSYVRTLQCEVHRLDKDDDQDDWTYSPDLESCSLTYTVKTMTSFTTARGVGQHHEHNEPKDSSVDGSENPTNFQVRAVYHEPRTVEAILDSGSERRSNGQCANT